jgi:hypothetical protein
MAKQSEKKCTLLFCDRLLYCLCPMFSMGLFMMFGGLCRDIAATKGAVLNYIFPLLHKTKNEGVADALSKAIKKYITKDYGDEMSKLFSSRSLRKAAMTHNRAILLVYINIYDFLFRVNKSIHILVNKLGRFRIKQIIITKLTLRYILPLPPAPPTLQHPHPPPHLLPYRRNHRFTPSPLA